MISRWRFVNLLLAAYIGWPLWRALIFFRKLGWKNIQPLRILVIPQVNRVGDLVCATPVFRAIKTKYPNSHLAVLISQSKESWQIIKNNPRVNEIIFYEEPDLIRKIRRGNYQWSFNLTNYPIPSPIAFLGLIPNRVKTVVLGRSLSEYLTDWLNNRRFLYRHHTYLPRHYLKLLEKIGIVDPQEIKEVFVSEAGEKKAEDFLRANNLSSTDLLVGISIAAGNKIKEWGDEKFAELTRAILRKYNAKILFLGVPDNDERLDQVLRSLPTDKCFKAAEFDLDALPSLIKRLKLFIAVDTGPIYIAHALKISLVDIIGPVDPTEQPPEDERSFLVRPPSYIHPSSFVFKRAGKLEDHKKAIQSISVKDVFSAVEKAISQL